MYMYGCLTFGKHPYMVLLLLAYLYDAQRMSSRTVGFLPYMNMPTRYILAAIHTINMNEIYSRTREVMISHDGIPNGMRTIMTMGDVKGTSDSTSAIVELGSVAAVIAKIRPMMIGNTTTDWSWPASCMLSTAEPIAAYIDE